MRAIAIASVNVNEIGKTLQRENGGGRQAVSEKEDENGKWEREQSLQIVEVARFPRGGVREDETLKALLLEV